VLALGAAVIAASSRAATTGSLCPAFAHGGLTYHWETVGTGWTCWSARPWVVKLSSDRVGAAAGSVKLTNGPKGYHCFASSTHKGYASGGLCYAGTLAYPKSGFTWNGT
jgi:hypothetical protein